MLKAIKCLAYWEQILWFVPHHAGLNQRCERVRIVRFALRKNESWNQQRHDVLHTSELEFGIFRRVHSICYLSSLKWSLFRSCLGFFFRGHHTDPYPAAVPRYWGETLGLFAVARAILGNVERKPPRKSRSCRGTAWPAWPGRELACGDKRYLLMNLQVLKLPRLIASSKQLVTLTLVELSSTLV